MTESFTGNCPTCGQKYHGDDATADSRQECPEPTIIWMDGDDSWNKCSECGEELLQETCDNGVRHECGKCGHEWWEGEFVSPTPADSRQAKP